MKTWRIEPLGPHHQRDQFDCGDESLNVFIRRHAGQNARRDISRTYIARPDDADTVAGFYTISAGSVDFREFPETLSRRIPRYPVPTAHLGRLAVDRLEQGRGLGGILLVDALRRIAKTADQIGIHAVTVHALNPSARKFHAAHRFQSFQDDPLHLYLPMATIRALIG